MAAITVAVMMVVLVVRVAPAGLAVLAVEVDVPLSGGTVFLCKKLIKRLIKYFGSHDTPGFGKLIERLIKYLRWKILVDVKLKKPYDYTN